MARRSLPADVDVPAELRQERIAALVRDGGFARVADLAERFEVSTVTVRTDLDALVAGGRIRRVRGGAVPPGALHIEQPFELAARQLAEEKRHIGEYAAALVSSGDSVLLDVGTTTTAIARALAAREDLGDVTVFTNGLNIALELERAGPRISVVVTGGTVRPLQHSLVGPLATVLLERITATIAFVGCNGVDPEAGVTNINLPETEVKRAMLLSARRRVVVADGSKVGEVELARVCELGEVSLLVTDRTADQAVVSKIVSSGCEVQLA